MNVRNVTTGMGWGKIRSAAARVVTTIVNRLDPEEREFRRIWPMIDCIEGLLVSPNQERWLFQMARSLPDGSTIVEIGSFKGRSTSCLAFGCRGTKKQVYAIDTFSGNSGDFPVGNAVVEEDEKRGRPYMHYGGYFFDDFCLNIKKCGLSGYVKPVIGYSADVAKGWNTPIDLLFIDGSHAYEDVLQDFEQFFPYVKPGGIVAFHDVVDTWPGPSKVWKEVAAIRLTETGNSSTLAFGKKPAVSTNKPRS